MEPVNGIVSERQAVRVMHPESPRQAVSFAKRFRSPYIAGGTWLQPSCERDRQWPVQLVALNPDWPEFRGIRETEEGLSIGALTTLDELARHPLMALYLPQLNGLIKRVAGPGVRHLGTVGGNLFAGGDLSALALALDTEVDLVGSKGSNRRPLTRWLPDRQGGDLLRSVSLPDSRGWRVSLEKLGYRERFSPTRATVACVHDGEKVQLAVCGEGGPGRLTVTEAMLRDEGIRELTDLAIVVDSELETLGWHDTRLRLAVRRMLESGLMELTRDV
ncbi:FAD binding domain-containing protein [Marinobacter sp. F3R11]|uniref:FAD binding domain-containing protein n=1 Tax=Marinobacter sp. F3R11 TaxID=2267231 RepID=UPI000DE85327|nr:FAD binding domain-containing protein [Marinobacter sp. F3R11]RBW48817.1 hypothetical protein DS878_11745 [Marinobacter sp. F3R11]